MAYQGIGKSNMLGHRVGAGNAAAGAEDEAIAKVYANRFCIPSDFEVRNSHAFITKTPLLKYIENFTSKN